MLQNFLKITMIDNSPQSSEIYAPLRPFVGEVSRRTRNQEVLEAFISTIFIHFVRFRRWIFCLICILAIPPKGRPAPGARVR
jgi:hypothetical protein